ncbi:MAG TPA: FAD-dependent oxidoreductase [Mycobacteriales bacterium]|jgi:NADH dehydrogenase FAD-containing subunit
MKHNVVIIGAGYAGVPAARRLARQVWPDEVTVTLVSAFGSFVERPRLHQLATGQDIDQVPLSRYLSGSGVELVTASVTRIDLAGREVHTTDERGGRRTLLYDTLVYALGSNIDVTSVPGVAEHCAILVGASAAFELRDRLTDLAERGGATATVCGGGLTGIETVTEIATAFPGIRTQLVSSGTPGGRLSDKARRYLDDTFTALGVRVVEDARVDRVEPTSLVLADGRHIPFELCVWAGGFTVPTLARTAGLAVNATGRALVDTTLRSVSHHDVYVIGDAAAVAGRWGEQLAMGCRSGGFTGPKVADVIAARLTGRDPKPFAFRYIHECISLGRRHGLVQFLNADETPKNRVLTGRKAITYKNTTLNGARLLFRHSGPVLGRRRHLVPTPTPITSRTQPKSSRVG